jgi:hypothetical protein
MGAGARPGKAHRPWQTAAKRAIFARKRDHADVIGITFMPNFGQAGVTLRDDKATVA